MNPQLLFGDIFLQDEVEYIYLGTNSGIAYFAKILDFEISKQVEKVFFKQIIRNKTTDSPLYAFVKLQSDGYKGRIASLTNPSNIIKSIKKINTCNEIDKENLVEEIRTCRGVPLGLKDLFAS